MDHDPTQTLKKPETTVTRDELDSMFPDSRFWVKCNANPDTGEPERFESGWSIAATFSTPDGEVSSVEIVKGDSRKTVTIPVLLEWQDDGSDVKTAPRSQVLREIGGVVISNPAEPLVATGFEQDRKVEVRELLEDVKRLSAGTYDPSVMSGHLLRQLDLLQQGEEDTERLKTIGTIRAIVDEMSYRDLPTETSSKVKRIAAQARYLASLYRTDGQVL